MQILKDAQGGEWPLEMKLPALRRVRAGCNVNFLAADGKEIEAVAQDFMLFAEVIYYLLQPEIEKRNLSRDEFDAKWDLQSLMNALPAVMEDFANFCPPFMRSELTSGAQEARKHFAKMNEQATKDGNSSPSELEGSLESIPTSSP